MPTARETLIAARDNLDQFVLLTSDEPIIERFLAPNRRLINEARNSVKNSLLGKQWKDPDKDLLKHPAAKDAFTSWQRAQTALDKVRKNLAYFVIRVIPAQPGPRLN